jgi:hypothetical protein
MGLRRDTATAGAGAVSRVSLTSFASTLGARTADPGSQINPK